MMLKKLKDENEDLQQQIFELQNELKNISADLDNYQTNFLDKVHYYIKISNIFGYIMLE